MYLDYLSTETGDFPITLTTASTFCNYYTLTKVLMLLFHVLLMICDSFMKKHG